DAITPPLPGGGLAQGRDQFVVGLSPGRWTGAFFHRTRHEHQGIAGHRELALPALAPQFQNNLAIVADVEVWDPFRSRLRQRIKRHFHAEWKAVLGTR